MKTFHRDSLAGHTAAILGKIPAMVCDASKGSKSQENGPFHRVVWPGLYPALAMVHMRWFTCDDLLAMAARNNSHIMLFELSNESL